METVMYDASVKEKFVELRAQGKSFAAIAEELGVSKTTLIDWSREMEEKIANLRAIHEDALREQYRIGKEHQLKSLTRRFEVVESELEKRDLGDVPTDKLFGMFLKLVGELRGEQQPLTLRRSTSGVDLADFQHVSSWSA